jgi:hypothetical protein
MMMNSRKYYVSTEYFKNQGLGLDFIASDCENTEISEDECKKLNLKQLWNFDKEYHKTIKLKCVEEVDENNDIYILGYYED